MPRTQIVDAIVLRVFDVGEADRSCVLFTRELGRVFARASGVRKLTSRMGGSLLLFRRVHVLLKESGAGYIVAGVRGMGSDERGAQSEERSTLAFFSEAQQGIELLLALVRNEEPLPEVFDATVAFLAACEQGVPHAALRYGFRLVSQLGFLPEDGRVDEMSSLSTEEIGRMASLLRVTLEDQLSVRLRAGDVAAALRTPSAETAG